jgi:hypothetical protein
VADIRAFFERDYLSNEDPDDAGTAQLSNSIGNRGRSTTPGVGLRAPEHNHGSC